MGASVVGALGVWLAGCGLPEVRCEAGQILNGRMCLGNCRVIAPPCYAEDGGLVLPEASVEDGTSSDGGGMDAALVCDGGASACNGACVRTESDPAHCGRCGMACAAGAGERASCVMGQCQSECLAGFERVGMACEVKVPRLIGPMSTSYVSSQRPTLRWEAPAGVDGAAVEVCSSRDCATVVQRGAVSGGAVSWRVERALSAGVYWWRVRGRVGATEGARTSHVWEFVVGARDRATDTQWGTLTDVNGDGFGDVVGAGRTVEGAAVTLLAAVHHGSARGLAAMPSWTAQLGDTIVPIGVQSAGDVNGDGFGDLLVGSAEAVNASMVASGIVTVFHGGASGLSRGAVLSGTAAGALFGAAVSAAGDFDGDGYGDVLVGAPGASPMGRMGAGAVYVFRGGQAGVSMAPARVIDGMIFRGALGAAVSGAHDVDADRYADVVVASPEADDLIEGENSVGRVMLFRGGATGLSASPVRDWTRLERMGDIPTGHRVGQSLAHAGDINGDGFGDIVFGSRDLATRRDVYWAQGSMAGPSMTPTRLVSPAAMDRAVGASVDVGDADADGFDDLLILSSNGTQSFVELRAGSAAGPRAAGASVQSSGSNYYWGVASAGDVDGDHRVDWLLGYQRCCVAPYAPAVFLVPGTVSLSLVVPATAIGIETLR